MEKVLSNGFYEMTSQEMELVDGGDVWTNIGNAGYVVCSVASVALAGTPIGWAALGATIIWGLH